MTPTGKPMSPSQLGEFKKALIPSFVFDAFNELIAKSYCNCKAEVTRKAVVDLIAEKNTDSQPWEDTWLDIEPAYELEGWTVQYHKGDYVSGSSYFVFVNRQGRPKPL